MKYRKKPVIIEAFQLLPKTIFPDWANGNKMKVIVDRDERWIEASIETLEGTMTASKGDWIIKGVKGELYPCKPDIFEATYEPVSDRPENMGGNFWKPIEQCPKERGKEC